jgi:ketol-acid reductoisomerase
MSKPELDKIKPLTPPIVNKKIKPNVNNKGALKFNQPPQIVANQLKIFMPVGIAITMVAAVK